MHLVGISNFEMPPAAFPILGSNQEQASFRRQWATRVVDNVFVTPSGLETATKTSNAKKAICLCGQGSLNYIIRQDLTYFVNFRSGLWDSSMLQFRLQSAILSPRLHWSWFCWRWFGLVVQWPLWVVRNVHLLLLWKVDIWKPWHGSMRTSERVLLERVVSSLLFMSKSRQPWRYPYS